MKKNKYLNRHLIIIIGIILVLSLIVGISKGCEYFKSKNLDPQSITIIQFQECFLEEHPNIENYVDGVLMFSGMVDQDEVIWENDFYSDVYAYIYPSETEGYFNIKCINNRTHGSVVFSRHYRLFVYNNGWEELSLDDSFLGSDYIGYHEIKTQRIQDKTYNGSSTEGIVSISIKRVLPPGKYKLLCEVFNYQEPYTSWYMIIEFAT